MAKTKGTGMMKWDKELAELATLAAGMEAGTQTGEKFSIKNGILSFNGQAIPGNSMPVIILDAILLNANYPDRFDPTNPGAAPDCFAMARSEADMRPHEVAVKAGTARATDCASCPLNQWGSADQGKGKACGNKRRLALIPAGEFNAKGVFEMVDDVDTINTAPIGYLEVPAASLKGYAGFVKQLVATMSRPPLGVATKVTVVPLPTVGHGITFEALETIPDSLMAAVLKRAKEASTLIDFPYPPYEKKVKKGAKAAPQRPARQPKAAPAAPKKAAKGAKAPAAGAKRPAATFGGAAGEKKPQY